MVNTRQAPPLALLSLTILAVSACFADDDGGGGAGSGVSGAGKAGAAGTSALNVGGRAGFGGKAGGAGAGAVGGSGGAAVGGAAGVAQMAGAAGLGGGGGAGTAGLGGSAGLAGAAGSSGQAGAAAQGGAGGAAGGAGTTGAAAASGSSGSSGNAGSAGGAGASGSAGGAGASGSAGGAGASGSAGGAGASGSAGGAGASGSAGAAGNAGAAGSGGEAGSAAACTDGATQPCYDGPVMTRNVGTCRDGTSTCAAGTWGACAGQKLPSVERANGRDDDCDAAVDDGVPVATAGAVNQLGPVGNNNTSEFDSFALRCPGQQVLVGMRAYVTGATSLVNAITALCAGLDKVPTPNIGPATHVLAWSELGESPPRVGGQLPSSVDLLCPTGKIVSTIHANAGGAVEQLELTCAELRWSAANGFALVVDPTKLNQGAGVSQNLFATCPDGTAFTDVFGVTKFDIHAIGFRCSTLVVTP